MTDSLSASNDPSPYTVEQLEPLMHMFLNLALAHPVLEPYYSEINGDLLCRKLATIVFHIFGDEDYDYATLYRTHQHLHLEEAHFDAVLQILDTVLDMEKDGERIVSWRLKLRVLREAEALREAILHPKNVVQQSSRRYIKVMREQGQYDKPTKRELSVNNMGHRRIKTASLVSVASTESSLLRTHLCDMRDMIDKEIEQDETVFLQRKLEDIKVAQRFLHGSKSTTTFRPKVLHHSASVQVMGNRQPSDDVSPAMSRSTSNNSEAFLYRPARLQRLLSNANSILPSSSDEYLSGVSRQSSFMGIHQKMSTCSLKPRASMGRMAHVTFEKAPPMPPLPPQKSLIHDPLPPIPLQNSFYITPTPSRVTILKARTPSPSPLVLASTMERKTSNESEVSQQSSTSTDSLRREKKGLYRVLKARCAQS